MDRLLKRLCVFIHFSTHVASKYDAKRSPQADGPGAVTAKQNAKAGKQTLSFQSGPRPVAYIINAIEYNSSLKVKYTV